MLQPYIKKILLVILVVLFLSIFLPLVMGVRIYGNGPGLIENSTWEQNLTDVYRGSLNLGDINNDTDLDLVLTGRASGTTGVSKVYENNGTSFSENTTWQQNLTDVYRSSTALGDIDNDGDLDLVLTGCDTNLEDNCPAGTKYTKIYENNGTQFLENSTWQQNLTAVYYGAVAFGDIDSDGDLDLVLTGYSTGGRISKIYLNNGTSYTESIQWQQNLTNIDQSAVVLGDVDKDLDLDLVLTGRDSNLNKISKIYLNNGTSLVESVQWQQNLMAVKEGALVLMDFDNDGDLDLDLTGCCDYNRLYHNNGTSFVLNQSEALGWEDLSSSFDGSVSFGDYDNDGDLDTAITGREGTSRVWNNNNTHFDRVHNNIIYPTQLMWSTIVWGDVDNDTDLDLIQMGGTVTTLYSEVYTNNLTNNPNEKPTAPDSFTCYNATSGGIHMGWNNGSDNETPSNGLYYNLRVGSSSKGNQIVSGKYGGGEDNGYFGNMMQRKNFTLKSTRLNPNTKYYWSVQTIDTGLRTSSWSSEQVFITQGDLTPPTITLNTVDNFNTSTPHLNVSFNATVYDNINVTNVTLWGNWSTGWHANVTNSTGLNKSMDYLFSVNLSMYDDGYYLWGIRACDNSSLCSISSNRTFSIDTTYPEIDLITLNDTDWTRSNSVVFEYNVSDVHISNCSLIVDGVLKETDDSITVDVTQEISTTLSNGDYNWFVNCTDEVNYQNNSAINKITVSYATSLDGGDSSGGVRAYTGEPREKPVKKVVIKDEHLREIPVVEKPKPLLVRWFEIIYAFIVALFMIFGYVWIVKKDFKRLKG